jgi:cobalamin biosynthesis protein CobC
VDRLRDHGGNLDWAIQQYGGLADRWIDLSTGINRRAYPLPPLSHSAWTCLPTSSSLEQLHDAARLAFRYSGPVLALAGAQAAIQLLPRIMSQGQVRVLGPTYNEHAAAFRCAGWDVKEVTTLEALAGADIAVAVNPNNPDGRLHRREDLLELSERVSRLVIDESFIDATPELSLAPDAGRAGLLVLRSFGKFYGLAGLRLGFVLGARSDIAVLRDLAGPWPVSGAAIEIGAAALRDRGWAQATSSRLIKDARRLDTLTAEAAWRLAGGTALFRLYETGNSEEARARLARHQIWSRAFPWSQDWLRLGLPGNEGEWERLAMALGE